jgi:alcohol dehydrogenase YqhD (iron-dependent ADH family)
MWTATLALNGLTAAGMGRVGFPMHMIEHSLSALYNVPHGAGLSVVIPGWLNWYRRHDEPRIAQLGRRIFPHADLQACTDSEVAERTVTILKNWFGKVNGPTSLEELNIPAADIPKIADNALSLARVWRLSDYSRETIEEILNLCR